MKEDKNTVPLSIKITSGLFLLTTIFTLFSTVLFLVYFYLAPNDPDVLNAKLEFEKAGGFSIVTIYLFATALIINTVALIGIVYLRRWAFRTLLVLFALYIVGSIIDISHGMFDLFSPEIILYPLTLYFVYKHKEKLS